MDLVVNVTAHLKSPRIGYGSAVSMQSASASAPSTISTLGHMHGRFKKYRGHGETTKPSRLKKTAQ